MKIHENLAKSRQSWLKKPVASSPYRQWLQENGSLTARLQRTYDDFAVQPIRIAYAPTAYSECILLSLPSKKNTYIRNVLLKGGGKPVVFAHSVIPRSSLQRAWRGLKQLGNRPLGATLFANPKVKRAPLQYKKLTANHALYHQALPYLANKPHFLWARRSIFVLNGAAILVTEVFLPTLIS